jgi:hypothetical protein
MLLLISFFILLSCLSENFEFLVHNEESLLILCFVSFIFFAYSFLSVTFFEGFKNKTLALENQLLIVVDTHFQALVSRFSDYFSGKGLFLRFQFVFTLAFYRSVFSWLVSSYIYKFSINWLILAKLVNLLRLKSEILDPIKLRTRFSLSPVLFGNFTFYLKRYFRSNFSHLKVKNSSQLKNSQFFRALDLFKFLYL